MLSQSGPWARASTRTRALRVLSIRTRPGSRSSRASRKTGAAGAESATPPAVVTANGSRRKVCHACSTSGSSTTAASMGRVTRRRTAAASAKARSRGPRSSSIEREQLLDHLGRRAGAERQPGPSSHGLAGDDDGQRMSPRERADPRRVVGPDPVGGKEPVDVLGGQWPDHQLT